MKIKYGNRHNWQRVLESSYRLSQLDANTIVATVDIHKISAPLFVTYESEIFNVADVGYRWVQFFFKNKHYAVTTVINSNNEIMQWYIDLCRPYNFTKDGIPYFIDLYLDIVIFPSNKVFILDEDELDAARDQGIISNEEYCHTWQVANDLLQTLHTSNCKLLNITKQFHLKNKSAVERSKQ
ncbi:MAG: DUF402 domain-containing protein [Bacillaceae bacterium]